MSTILDALKKVEQERDSDSAASKKRQLEALTPSADNGHQGPKRKFIKWGALLLIVAFLSGVTLYLFSGDGDEPPAESKSARVTAPAPKSPRPAKKVKNTTVARDRSTRPPAQTPGPRPSIQPQPGMTTQLPDKTPVPLNQPNQPPVATPPAPGQESRTAVLDLSQPNTNRPPATPSPQPGIRRPRPDRERQAPARPSVQPKPETTTSPKPQPKQPPQPAPAPAKRDIPRLTDGSLKVQAIAWSPIADERMAVINTKIVREGASVDDYTVVTIREDDVVVRGGGGEYRVVIGRN